MENKLKTSLGKLENYLDATDLKGYDPYDALNSKLLTTLSFNTRLLRLIYTQLLKRSPINLRFWLGVKKDYNPKGLGLFLSAYLKLFSLQKSDKYLQKINEIISTLEQVKCDGYSGYCWGYNFDWQGEIEIFKQGTPTIVNTVYIAHALLDAYELLGEEKYYEMARSSCDFILNDLNVLRSNGSICFSYTPDCKSKIHNANVLGAGLLARIYAISQEEHLLKYAKMSVNYTIERQRDNGSWSYGEDKLREGRWYQGISSNGKYQNDEFVPGYVSYIDNYHTGFVLESLYNYTKFTNDQSYIDNIYRGLEFYQNNFFLQDGTPKYFHDRIYPIDIHSSAQAIITLVRLNDLLQNDSLLQKVTRWMIDHMQKNHNYFYFRKGRFFYNKIPYIRWSQAWAFEALVTYYQFLANKSGG